MAVLVSGASGFLGGRLIERLAANGQDVVAVARQRAPKAFAANPRVHWVVKDIAKDGLDPASLPVIESVVHLAGATLGAGKDENMFLIANEQTTVRLLQAVVNRTEHFVFASSQVVYGDACHLAVTEDFPVRPEGTAYACSKVNSENWVRWFQKRYGGQYLVLRFCGFIDGGGIVDYLIDQALVGDPIELYSEGKVRRDYVSSNDGVDAIVAALNYRVGHRFLPVNIGSGQGVAALELATLVCSELKSSSRIELRRTKSPQGDFVFCIDRAKEILNFRPSSLIDAVRKHARYRAQFTANRANNEKN